MKSKGFRGKLKLNKKTIANLANGNMNGVFGGIRTDGCPSWIKTDCTCETYCYIETNCPPEVCPPPPTPTYTEVPEAPECISIPFYCTGNCQ
jgi:hypothetical protein